MQNSILQFARRSAAPREAEREVVAAISSAEGSANLARGGGRRAVGFALPLLAFAAGAALGYSSSRWLSPSPWRRIPPDRWQRVADAARPILEAAGKARFPTLR